MHAVSARPATGDSSNETTPRWFPVAVLLLVFAAVVPWRSGAYFEGKVDAVVLAKAFLTVLAVLLAWASYRVGPRFSIAVEPIVFLAAYLTVTTVGAMTGTTFMSTGVIVVRVALVATALTLLSATYGEQVVAASLMRVFLIMIAVAVLTGIGTVTTGRLRGGFPPLNPNELGFLAAACLLWVTARFLRAEETMADYPLAVTLFGIVYLSGSRTTLLAAGIGIALMATQVRRLSVGGLVLGLISLPVAAYGLLVTDLLPSVLERGGASSVATLSNRTIAWNAAFSGQTAWNDTLFGRGLSVKKVEVLGQWWNTQILDSSWVSALVQAGYFGIILIALWAFATIVLAFRVGHPWAGLWIGLSVYLVARSSLESGLFDASTSFVVFWVVSMALWGTRHKAHPPNSTAQRASLLTGPPGCT